MEFVPLSYLPGNAIRIKVVAVGDLGVQEKSAVDIDWEKFPYEMSTSEDYEEYSAPENLAMGLDVRKEKSQTEDGILCLTEDDVEKISLGAAILVRYFKMQIVVSRGVAGGEGV